MSTQWKQRERDVARLLGGTRVGPSGQDTNDVDHPVLAIEVKYRSHLPAWAIECLEQARKARRATGKIPIAVLAEKGRRNEDNLVVMRLGDFLTLKEKDGPALAPPLGVGP